MYCTSLEDNISDNEFLVSQMNLGRESSIAIHEGNINNSTPKSSPAEQTFIPPKMPIMVSNPFKEQYDESKNPFAEDDDKNNPFSDDYDDYDKNLNPF